LSAHTQLFLFFLSVFLFCTTSAVAVPVFNSSSGTDGINGNGGGEIAFGVSPWGLPLDPGAPTYSVLNAFNLKNDILTNPGIGQTANPVMANNTSSVIVPPWLPGGGMFLSQFGGGNAAGPFGTGKVLVTGPKFGFSLSDGGLPGGVSTSYEVMSWDANFTDAAGSAPGSVGTFITMAGSVPLVQDLALVSLRTELVGAAFPGGSAELPGLILAVERIGLGNTLADFNILALQDNVNGGDGATAMPGGYAVLIDGAGNFSALAFNAFPDNLDGAIDGVAIPAGTTFTARVTATVYSDPSTLELIDPFSNPALISAAEAQQGTPFPTNLLFEQVAPVPEPTALYLAMIGALGLAPLRRRRCQGKGDMFLTGKT